MKKKFHEALDREEHQNHQRKVLIKCNEWVLTARVFLPEHNHCPCTRVICETEKLNWAAGQLVLNGFSRRVPKLWIHQCQNRHKGALKQHTAPEMLVVKNPLRFTLDSREGPLLPQSCEAFSRSSTQCVANVASSCIQVGGHVVDVEALVFLFAKPSLFLVPK